MFDLTKSEIKKQVIIPTKLSPQLAELCGIHIGDGYLGFRPNKQEYVIQCTGNLKSDKPYYDQYIRALWKNVFNINVKFLERKDNTCELRVYSKSIALFFNIFLELPFGKKSRIISIPNTIKKTCRNNVSKEMVSCIRGIMDTDFYLVKDRGYLELGAWFASRELILDLQNYLEKMGFNPKVRLDVGYYNKSSKKNLIRHQIRIRKKEDLSRWFSVIGTNNPKIYKRYQEFTNSNAPVV
ncbi:hypothetical protein COY27_03775 [Candidatus Woesearchaeota archaeon CG_4_10_14_0_2_um_filter_33_13]|nr:MAG: hypothetical protein COY27_03775 [Candidatus Woesearchaeota archaeon CG_4_10_14_0_2_um_filter_33_13]